MFENTSARTPAAEIRTSTGRASCVSARVCMASTTPENPSNRPTVLRSVRGSQAQPGPPVAGDAQAGEPCAGEQRTPGEEEADPEDGERRRGAGEDAAGDERGCPEKDVEECGGRSQEARRMMPR